MFVMWKILLEFRERSGLMNLRNMGRSRLRQPRKSVSHFCQQFGIATETADNVFVSYPV